MPLASMKGFHHCPNVNFAHRKEVALPKIPEPRPPKDDEPGDQEVNPGIPYPTDPDPDEYDENGNGNGK